MPVASLAVPPPPNVPEIAGVPYDQGLYSLYTSGYKSALSWLTGGAADTFGGCLGWPAMIEQNGKQKHWDFLFFQNYHLEKQV